MTLRMIDTFSGIGGFSLGLERTGGFQTVAFCEIDPFCRKVLAKHWPNVRQYEDVRTLTADTLARDGIGVDVITGGFPCQDVSSAGRKAGIREGTRSGLWSEISRLVSELRPQFVIVENVANLLSGPSDRRGGWFGRVLGDLAEIGYDAEWHCIPASSIGAHHRRDRVWIVANPECWRLQSGHVKRTWTAAIVPPAFSRYKRGSEFGEAWRAEPGVGKLAYGLPDQMDRIKSIGNAIVPQIPELIGRAILAASR